MVRQQTEKLSVYEWRGLASKFNLATAYPRQTISTQQRMAMNNLTHVLVTAHASDELASKEKFEHAFFTLAGQTSVQSLNTALAQYSGSIAIEVMANYLRLHKKSVTLVQPTFDTLADALKRHNIPLLPIAEDQVLRLTEASPRILTDALYIVCPNNPTGRCPSKEQFTNIVAYCKKYRILLIIDFCFRFYGDFWNYDQYQLLQDANIDFITTEDTGKTWPSADIKLGMVLSSPSLHKALRTISNDFLVGISPFIFELMCRYIGVEGPEKRRILSQDLVDVNRTALRRLLEDTPLQLTNQNARVSIEWLKLPESWQAVSFVSWLHEHGIQLLPGERFYWHRHEQGRRYIRIALLSESNYFHNAAILLRDLSNTYAVTPKA